MAHGGHPARGEDANAGPCRPATPPLPTARYVVQTMLRVNDPKDSLDFYTRVLGMTLLCKLDFADMKFRCSVIGM